MGILSILWPPRPNPEWTADCGSALVYEGSYVAGTNAENVRYKHSFVVEEGEVDVKWLSPTWVHQDEDSTYARVDRAVIYPITDEATVLARLDVSCSYGVRTKMPGENVTRIRLSKKDRRYYKERL